MKASSPRQTSIEMLSRLVAFDTTSRNSNLDMIGFVREWLDSFDVPYRLSFDAAGQKANLHAIIGPVQPGGLAFSGHLDTVSVDGQTWTGSPFELRRDNGRLIGRGSCDMKGFVASALAAVPDITTRRLSRPVHLLLTYDEEVGYIGVRQLVDDLKKTGLLPTFCVVGEASEMRPVLAQKGRLIVRVRVRGHPAHSSGAHRGLNAVHAAAEAISWLAGESRRLAETGPRETGFDPPYTTLQVSNFRCDAMPNSIPAEAEFDVEWRNIPATDPQRELGHFQKYVTDVIESRIHRSHPACGFDYEVLLDLAALSLSPEHDLARAAFEATGTQVGGKVSYCSEGSLYQPAGISCIVCGPGDVSQAHQPDEWISENQLVACDEFIRRIVDRLAV